MSEATIDANDVINNLSQQIAVLIRDNTVLKVQVDSLTRALGEKDTDGSDTV